jgi:hypothetical protein
VAVRQRLGDGDLQLILQPRATSCCCCAHNSSQ